MGKGEIARFEQSLLLPQCFQKPFTLKNQGFFLKRLMIFFPKYGQGLLERPPLSAHIEEVSYKVFLSGKAGVGKTCAVAKLTGHDIPKQHAETSGK